MVYLLKEAVVKLYFSKQSLMSCRQRHFFSFIMICKYTCNTHDSWLIIKKYNHKTGKH